MAAESRDARSPVATLQLPAEYTMSGSSTLVIPEGYVLLRDAFNEIGRELFGENWTYLELAAEGDENDKAAVERRSRAESAFRGRAHAGHIEAFLLYKETGELYPCPRQCWLAEPIEINWSSSTMELVNRSAEEASPKTEPPILDPISRPEQFEEWLESQRSPIEGMLWHYQYRVLVQQASRGGHTTRPPKPVPNSAKVAERVSDDRGDEGTDKDASDTAPSPGDTIGKRIKNVVQAAAEMRKKNKYLSDAQIANRLAPRDSTEKFSGYGYEAIRKIISGKYAPAERRGISN